MNMSTPLTHQENRRRNGNFLVLDSWKNLMLKALSLGRTWVFLLSPRFQSLQMKSPPLFIRAILRDLSCKGAVVSTKTRQQLNWSRQPGLRRGDKSLLLATGCLFLLWNFLHVFNYQGPFEFFGCLFKAICRDLDLRWWCLFKAIYRDLDLRWLDRLYEGFILGFYCLRKFSLSTYAPAQVLEFLIFFLKFLDLRPSFIFLFHHGPLPSRCPKRDLVCSAPCILVIVLSIS